MELKLLSGSEEYDVAKYDRGIVGMKAIKTAQARLTLKQAVEMFNTMEVRDQWVNVPQPVRQIIEQLRKEAEK